MPTCDPTRDCPPTPRWLHRWAVFTACATFVLLLLGSLVTTRQVGMADPVWPTTPWYLFFASWQEPRPGFLLEHSHRLAGYAVGCCTIALAVGLWLSEPRRWLRRLGVVALLGVIVQGLLGGFRVKLDELLGPNLALLHGCFAQVVFALLVAVAVFTAAGWSAPRPLCDDPVESARLRRWSLLTAALVYLQIVFGAVLRHTYSPLGQRGHLIFASVVVFAVAWLAKEVWDRHAEDRSLRRAATLLAVLVGAQILIGAETWLRRYLYATSAPGQLAVRTVHVLQGFLIFSAAVAVALQAHRRTVPAVKPAVAPVGRLEGVA